MKIRITALALAVLLPLTAIQAAEPDKAKQDDRWQKADRQWEQSLNLDENQRAQFQQKNEAHRVRMQEQRNKWKQQQSKQREEHFRKQQALSDRHHKDLRKLLNDEQKARFDNQLEQRKERQQAWKNQGHKGQPHHKQQRHSMQHKGMHHKSGHRQHRNNPRSDS